MNISSIASGVKNSIKDMYKNPFETSAKAMGMATALTVLYDSHINGKENAITKDYFDSSDRFRDNLQNKMTLYKRSQSVANAKEAWYEFNQTLSFPHVISKSQGYLGGVGQTIMGNIPEIALSIAALCTKKCKPLGLAAGALLCLNFAKTFVCDVVGFGTNKDY